jgi:hypothetical protein
VACFLTEVRSTDFTGSCLKGLPLKAVGCVKKNMGLEGREWKKMGKLKVKETLKRQ